MAKIARNQSSGRYTIVSTGKGSAIISDARTGKQLPLKGYGALKGEFEVRKGLDLCKPIAAQVPIRKTRKSSAAKTD
jgi:hypothetical protein